VLKSHALFVLLSLALSRPLAGAQGPTVLTPDSPCGGAVDSELMDPDRQPAPQEPGVAAEDRGPVLYLAVLTGGSWPVASMNVIYDPSFQATARGELAVSPNLRLGAQVSFHSFDAERPGEADNEGVVNLALFGKALGDVGPYRPFALLGVGAYVSKEKETGGRRWDGGMQFGAGFELPLSEYLSAVAGTGLHLVYRGGGQDDYLWLDGYLGFLFRQP